MIKGILHRAMELLRSPCLDFTILNFRLLAVKRPPATLAFENRIKCWQRITLVLIRSLKEKIFKKKKNHEPKNVKPVSFLVPTMAKCC